VSGEKLAKTSGKGTADLVVDLTLEAKTCSASVVANYVTKKGKVRRYQ
jgi:hypothetical protein